jgi:hypothetical protein
MENINFSLNEIEINKDYFDENEYLKLDEDDIEALKLYYNEKYTIKGLLQILQYYGLSKGKMVKDEMLQVLLFFETDQQNKDIVERRMRLWSNIQELKRDVYFSKYILF